MDEWAVRWIMDGWMDGWMTRVFMFAFCVVVVVAV